MLSFHLTCLFPWKQPSGDISLSLHSSVLGAVGYVLDLTSLCPSTLIMSWQYIENIISTWNMLHQAISPKNNGRMQISWINGEETLQVLSSWYIVIIIICTRPLFSKIDATKTEEHDQCESQHNYNSRKLKDRSNYIMQHQISHEIVLLHPCTAILC